MKKKLHLRKITLVDIDQSTKVVGGTTNTSVNLEDCTTMDTFGENSCGSYCWECPATNLDCPPTCNGFMFGCSYNNCISMGCSTS